MASEETTSDNMEFHWKEDDGRMAMAYARSIRQRRPTFDRIQTLRGAITEPMAVPRRGARWRVALWALLVGALIACAAGLLR